MAGIAPQPEKQPQSSTNRQNQDALAHEIATSFKDNDHLSIYEVYCRNYPMEDVKRAFNKVRAVPEKRVKRSRLALFIYLLKSYARKEE